MPMKTPQDLFVHELSDIRSAEQIIVQMLGEAQGMVQNPQLKQGLQKHEQETRQQIQNLDQIFQLMGTKPHPVQCRAVEGLRQGLTEVRQSQPSPQVLDGVIVDGAAKTEHYEIAAYTGLLKQARAMGQPEAARLLEQNLQQEQNTLRQVEQIGDQLTQQMAPMAGRHAD
jgi:ferritin-like metal-binding protein YciE